MGCQKLTCGEETPYLKVVHNTFKINKKSGAELYRYGFNGMEKNNEVTGNTYTTFNRIYDARIGRWFSLDPYKAKYPSVSPYHGLANNPILFVDYDGNENTIFIYVSSTAKTDPQFKGKTDAEIHKAMEENIKHYLWLAGVNKNVDIKLVESPVAPYELDPTDSFVYIAGGTNEESVAELNRFDNQYKSSENNGEENYYMGGENDFDDNSGYLERSSTNEKGGTGHKGGRNIIGLRLSRIKEFADYTHNLSESVSYFTIWHGLGHNIMGHVHSNTKESKDFEEGTFIHRSEGWYYRRVISIDQIKIIKAHYGQNKPKDNRAINKQKYLNKQKKK